MFAMNPIFKIVSSYDIVTIYVYYYSGQAAILDVS